MSETPTMTLDPPGPHRRRNALTGQWVIVSPQRTQRPWQGQTSEARRDERPVHDPSCYLCPGNERAGGARNPSYRSTFVFENDFAALLPADRDRLAPSVGGSGVDDDLFGVGPASGECRVMCFSPRHDLALADLDTAQMGVVVELWCAQQAELIESYEWVQVFETRGAISGASNPHPHGQVWASSFLPDEAVRELEHQRRHRTTHAMPLLVDYAQRELDIDERVVVANDHWVVVVPYWAYWPYETLVLPRRPVASLVDLRSDERQALAEVLPTMLRAFDRLFDTPFPYCSGWHSAPRSAAPTDGWQLHAHYLPPLLRSADVAKIPASYELLANLQRDLTAEDAARALRAVV